MKRTLTQTPDDPNVLLIAIAKHPTYRREWSHRILACAESAQIRTTASEPIDVPSGAWTRQRCETPGPAPVVVPLHSIAWRIA